MSQYVVLSQYNIFHKTIGSNETTLGLLISVMIVCFLNQRKAFNLICNHCDSELAQQQVIISQIKEEVSKIEATPTLEASDDAKLRGLQELLETSKEELRHLDWIG